VRTWKRKPNPLKPTLTATSRRFTHFSDAEIADIVQLPLERVAAIRAELKV